MEANVRISITPRNAVDRFLMFDLAVLVHLEADTDKTPILTEVLSHDAVSTADSHRKHESGGLDILRSRPSGETETLLQLTIRLFPRPEIVHSRIVS